MVPPSGTPMMGPMMLCEVPWDSLQPQAPGAPHRPPGHPTVPPRGAVDAAEHPSGAPATPTVKHRTQPGHGATRPHGNPRDPTGRNRANGTVPTGHLKPMHRNWTPARQRPPRATVAITVGAARRLSAGWLPVSLLLGALDPLTPRTTTLFIVVVLLGWDVLLEAHYRVNV